MSACSVATYFAWAAGELQTAARRVSVMTPMPESDSSQGAERRVVSAVCPHEGCEVEWDGGQRKFLCPCHDSVFDADGARLSGPAQSDLARLPTRANGDALEIQYGDAAQTPTQPGSPTNG